MSNSFSLTEQAKNIAKYKIKKKVKKAVFVFIKPFIVPIIIFIILLMIISSITDVLYIAFDNDDEIDMKQELAYYNTSYDKENDKEEVKSFFRSVFEFTDMFFGGGEMSEETDWPVERVLFNFKSVWSKKSSYSWSINISQWNGYSCTSRNKTCMHNGW